MAVIAQLAARLSADTSNFKRGMRGARKELSGFQSAVGSLGTSLKLAIGGFLTVGTMKKTIDLFAESESAVNTLKNSLALAGDTSASSVKDLTAFATAIQSVTTVDDEAVLGLASLGASMGKLTGEGLKAATVAAIGLSEAFKIDTKAAMVLVAKAAQGNTSALSRYGLVLDESLTKQEKFGKVLEMGTKAFALAEGKTQTYAGQVAQLKNSFGDLGETIGGLLVPVAQSLVSGLQGSIVGIQEWGTELQSAFTQVGGFLGGMFDNWKGTFELMGKVVFHFVDSAKLAFADMMASLSKAVNEVNVGANATWALIKGKIQGKSGMAIAKDVGASFRATKGGLMDPSKWESTRDELGAKLFGESAPKLDLAKFNIKDIVAGMGNADTAKKMQFAAPEQALRKYDPFAGNAALQRGMLTNVPGRGNNDARELVKQGSEAKSDRKKTNAILARIQRALDQEQDVVFSIA